MQKLYFIEVTPEELIEEVITRLQNYKKEDIVNESYLTVEEVAQLFKVSLSTIYSWRKNGILKACQIGGRVYFKQTEIDSAVIDLNPTS